MSINRLLIVIALWLAAAAWLPIAHAASCLINETAGATLVEFDPYASGGPAVDNIGQIDLSCMPDLPLGLVPYTLSISPGSGTFAQRLFVGGAGDLPYNLYIDPSRLLVFGDGSPGTQNLSAVCTGSCPVLVYGRIFAGTMMAPGQYTDTVTVTLEF